MDKQLNPTNMPKQSIFSKPNFYKFNQNIKKGSLSTPKFDKTVLPKTNVIVTQHKGGS